MRHGRHVAYPPERRPTRRRRPRSGTARYAVTWLAGTAAAVIALALALQGMEEPSASLASAVERASCRLDGRPGGPAAYLDAAMRADTVVVRYRASLSDREVARLQLIAQRLGGRAVTVASAPKSAATVEATAAGVRMACPRVDRRTEAALTLFIRSDAR